MTCPHFSDGPGKFMTCGLIAGKHFPAPGKPNNPCATCQAEWTDGQPPTCESLTPTLARMAPSRGLGDTVAKFTHATGIAAAAHLVSRVTGVPCGCAERQQRWNAAVPYKTT